MKKIIRLTESDLYRIVKKVINEQINFDPNTADYFSGSDNDQNPNKVLYFVKNGDTYQTWIERSDTTSRKRGKASFLGLLPKAESLTATFKTIDNQIRLVLTGESIKANKIYSEMYGGDKGVAVVLNGKPYLANMVLSGVIPYTEKELENRTTTLKGKNSVEPKPGNEITIRKSFFITEKPNDKKGKYGKGSEINLEPTHTVQSVRPV